MKITYASLFLAASLPAFAQKAGDTVTPDALGKLEWVQGTAPAEWEAGKVYVLECWATWCGPCIAAIPHIDGLYDKYQEKGLRVIGVNVWEDGKDKVEAFVNKKGDGMSYPVAYTGKGGVFETEWLTPAGVRGIPHAFVVKDGKVLATAHPMRLTEPVVEGLLAGGETETKALDEIKAAQRKQEDTAKAVQTFRQATLKKDLPGMEAAFADLKKTDSESGMLPLMDLELLMMKKDWPAAEATLAKLSETPQAGMIATTAAQKLNETPDAPESFRKLVISGMSKQLENGGHAIQFLALSRIQWSVGDKDGAKASAQRAIEWTKSPSGVKTGLTAASFEKFAQALENDEMPTAEQTNTWIRESLPARPATRVTPEKEK